MCVLSLRAAAVRVTHHHQQPTRLPICVASFAEQTARSFALLSLSCLSSSLLEILVTTVTAVRTTRAVRRRLFTD